MVLCIRHGLVRLSSFPSLCSPSKLAFPKRSKSHSRRASGSCFDFEDFEGRAFFFLTIFFFPFLGSGCLVGSEPSTCNTKSWVANPTVSLVPETFRAERFERFERVLRNIKFSEVQLAGFALNFEDLWRGSYMITMMLPCVPGSGVNSQ